MTFHVVKYKGGGGMRVEGGGVHAWEMEAKKNIYCAERQRERNIAELVKKKKKG